MEWDVEVLFILDIMLILLIKNWVIGLFKVYLILKMSGDYVVSFLFILLNSEGLIIGVIFNEVIGKLYLVGYILLL